MRFPFRAILLGLLIGGLFFIAPVGLPFLAALFFLFLASRLLGGRRRWYHRSHYFSPHHPIPIDGNGPFQRPASQSAPTKINIE